MQSCSRVTAFHTLVQQRKSDYPVTFFACLTFAHRFFATFTIVALPAADRTRLS
jgi:hypothetical protein